MAGSDDISSGARRCQGGQVNHRQHHISYIPIRTHRHQDPPHPLTIVGVLQFPDISNRYTPSGDHGGGLGVAAASTSEPVRISDPETFVVDTGMMDRRER